MIDPVPEWVESQSKPINGLDLTGLRLPVDAISTYQMIGITTVTPRIRFLTIRAWIVKAFAESGLPSSQGFFIDFALRVEAAIIFAVLLNNRNLLHLPGVSKALAVIDEGQDPIVLERLVDQPAFNLYAGTTYNLFLGFPLEYGLSGLTKERGLPLAEGFEALIRKTRYFDLLKTDPMVASISRADLQELGLAIELENIGKNEHACLLESLMPAHPAPDWEHREIRRIAAYTLFLELANYHQRLPKEGDIFRAALATNPSLSPQLTSVLDGYLCYRIRDALAVVHESVLGLVSRELGGHARAIQHDTVIQAVVADPACSIALRNLEILTADETVDTVRFRTFAERVEARLAKKQTARGLVRWEGNLDENTIIETALKNPDSAAGLMPVVWLLCRQRVTDQNPEAFPHLRILFQTGSARFGMREVIFPQLTHWFAEDLPLGEVIAWLVQRTVDQHLRIAWSRMFADMKKDVAILLCDGDTWQHRARNYAGGRMASRIKDAIGWLSQLALVGEKGLTPSGEEVLQHGYEMLTRLGGES